MGLTPAAASAHPPRRSGAAAHHGYPPVPRALPAAEEAEKLLVPPGHDNAFADDVDHTAASPPPGRLRPSSRSLHPRRPWWHPWRPHSAAYAPLLGSDPDPRAPRQRPRGRLSGRTRALAIAAGVLVSASLAWTYLRSPPPGPSSVSAPGLESATALSADDLLGDYLRSSKLILTDPYRLAHLALDPDSIQAPDLDMHAAQAGERTGTLSLPLPPGSGPNTRANPLAVFTPQWAAEPTLAPIPAYRAITANDACLLAWVSDGMICPELREQHGARPSAAPAHLPPIDIVFTWANGSDPLHDQAKQYWAYCMFAHSAPQRDAYCPHPYVSLAEDGAQSLSPHVHEEYRTKLGLFLRDIYPLLRKAETGERDTDYFARRNREKKVGYSHSRFLYVSP